MGQLCCYLFSGQSAAALIRPVDVDGDVGRRTEESSNDLNTTCDNDASTSTDDDDNQSVLNATVASTDVSQRHAP